MYIVHLLVFALKAKKVAELVVLMISLVFLGFCQRLLYPKSFQNETQLGFVPTFHVLSKHFHRL